MPDLLDRIREEIRERQLQYAPDVGEAFARAALLDYRGASVHNLGGAVASLEEIAGEITAAASALPSPIRVEGPALPFPSDVDGASSSSCSAAR